MRSSLELRRKLFHIVSLLLWIPPLVYLPGWLLTFIFVVVIFLNTLVVFRVNLLQKLFKPLIENLERERNLSSPGIQALYANLGIFISYLLFGNGAAVVGTVVLAVGDGFSGLVGYYLGRHRLFYNPQKTLEGQVSFLVSSVLALSFLMDYSKALLIATATSFLEGFPLRWDDNLTLPLFGSCIYYLT